MCVDVHMHIYFSNSTTIWDMSKIVNVEMWWIMVVILLALCKLKSQFICNVQTWVFKLILSVVEKRLQSTIAIVIISKWLFELLVLLLLLLLLLATSFHLVRYSGRLQPRVVFELLGHSGGGGWSMVQWAHMNLIQEMDRNFNCVTFPVSFPSIYGEPKRYEFCSSSSSSFGWRRRWSSLSKGKDSI